jgi:pyridinium-3,5-bisthiocarboxylic acid mononucleotide nickel chelatase
MSDVVLILAQIDDAPGELLGRVLDQLTGLGAKNVQLLAGVGKKGRPGYTLLVDVPAEAEEEVAVLLAGELGVWGYRVLQAEHKHFDIRRHTLDLELDVGGSPRRFPLRIKRILHGGRFLRAKAEHDDLARICAELSRSGEPTPVAVLKARVESTLGADEPGERLVVHLAPTEPSPRSPARSSQDTSPNGRRSS